MKACSLILPRKEKRDSACFINASVCPTTCPWTGGGRGTPWKVGIRWTTQRKPAQTHRERLKFTEVEEKYETKYLLILRREQPRS